MEWFVGEESICQNHLFPWFAGGGLGGGGFFFPISLRIKLRSKFYASQMGYYFFLKIQRCCSQVTQVPKTSLLAIFSFFFFL